MTAPDVHRCRRGLVCAERIRYELDDGTTAWVGALLADPGLCRSCARHIGSAINQLPGDIGELSELLVPTGEHHFRDPDLPDQPKVKQHSPLPMREDLYALIELIDFEVCAWANHVARATGMVDAGEWSIRDAALSSRTHRVGNACKLLHHRLAWLLGLPVLEYPARSKTTRRTDGHDPDTTTRYGDDYWTHRDGIDGGLLLLRLHKDAEMATGRAPADQLPGPCPACRRPALVRLHSSGLVDCLACPDGRMTDAEYDAHFYGLGVFYGLNQPRRRKEHVMTAPALPTGVVKLRPIDYTVHALPLEDHNLAEARDWCGGTLHADTAAKPVRRWIKVPGVVRIGLPGDVLVRYPGDGRTPPTFDVLGVGQVQAGFETAR